MNKNQSCQCVPPTPPPSAPEQLLNNPNLLTPNAYSDLRDNVNTAKLAIRTLDVKLERDRKAKAELEAYVLKHEQILYAARSRALPQEIWSEVFLICQMEYEERLFSHALSSKAPCVQLGHVCRSWRKIATKTPILWSNILVNAVLLFNTGGIAVMDLWLTRSGTLPLQVSARLLHATDEQSSTLLRLISYHSHHLASLQLTVTRRGLQSSGFKINHAPLLRILKIRCLAPGRDSYGSKLADHQLLDAGSSPLLDSVELCEVIPMGRALYHLPFADLKSADLSFNNMDHLKTYIKPFLDSCTSLTHLEVSVLDEFEEWESSFKLSHESLQSLTVDYGGHEILRCLKVPSLQRLSSTNIRKRYSSVLSSFVGRTKSLRELSLGGDDYESSPLQGIVFGSCDWTINTLKVSCEPDEHLASFLAALSNKRGGNLNHTASMSSLEIRLSPGEENSDSDLDQLGVIRIKDSIIDLCRQMNDSSPSSTGYHNHRLEKIVLDVYLWDETISTIAQIFLLLREVEAKGFEYRLTINDVKY